MTIIPEERKCVTLTFLQTEQRIRHLRYHFTSGCFDLFHPGHAYVLSIIRRIIDEEDYKQPSYDKSKGVLVVGVNSDESVEEWKGQKPVMPYVDRQRMVAIHSAVDFVVGFSSRTPRSLIQALEPVAVYHGHSENRLAWGPDSVDELQRFEGEVRKIPIVGSWSTTAIIEKVVKEFFDAASV